MLEDCTIVEALEILEKQITTLENERDYVARLCLDIIKQLQEVNSQLSTVNKILEIHDSQIKSLSAQIERHYLYHIGDVHFAFHSNLYPCNK